MLSRKDMRLKLQSLSRDGLNIVAKKLRVWWNKYHNHVYGIAGLISLSLTVFFYFKPTDVELSLDIGIYYEDKQGKLQYITEWSALHSGDAYALYVRPSDDCYLYIVQVDDSGRSYRLFPNEEYNTGINPLEAGKDYWIPNTGQYLVLDETIGKERFYIFASSDRITELEGASTLQKADFDPVLETMGVAGLKDKPNPYHVKPPKQTHAAEVKKKLQAEGAFVYETWFWHR